MNVRDAVESDLESMAELLLHVHQMHVAAQGEIYREISLEKARELLALDLWTRMRVCEWRSSTLKCMGIAPQQCKAVRACPSFNRASLSTSTKMVVRPGSRRTGVGRAFFADLLEFARGKAPVRSDWTLAISIPKREPFSDLRDLRLSERG